MTDKDYTKLLSFKSMHGSAMIPFNSNAIEFNEQVKNDDIVYFKNVTKRDLSLHRGYFLMLADVWGFLPVTFKNKVSKEYFYTWLKLYQGKYKVIFKFKDGRELIEYESISFSKMDNNQFKDYIKTQIPVWYELFQELLPNDFANSAIETIEENFERLLSKL